MKTKTIMVRYKTLPAHADANEALIKAVFAQLHERAPKGLRYTSMRHEDGTFVHVATVEGDDNPLVGLPAFKAFQKDMKERCAEQPVVAEVKIVGSYG